MNSVAVLRSQIETRLPGAFLVYTRPKKEVLATGISQLDALIGGIPKQAVSQICGAPSSGRTAVLMSLLANVTRQEFCALVDASDCFDPISAEAVGVNLSRLLWVRCGGESKSCKTIKNAKPELKPVEQAFSAADLLLQGSGFGLLVVDLASINSLHLRKVPLSTWFRFSRAIEGHPAALVFVLQEAMGSSYAHLVLRFRSHDLDWSATANRDANHSLAHSILLQQLRFTAEIQRCRERKTVVSTNPQLTAAARWA